MPAFYIVMQPLLLPWQLEQLSNRTASLSGVWARRHNTVCAVGAGGVVQVLSASGDRQLRTWDVEGGSAVRTMQAQQVRVCLLRPAPDRYHR